MDASFVRDVKRSVDAPPTSANQLADWLVRELVCDRTRESAGSL